MDRGEPAAGMPEACEYCFLNERGQTAVRPEYIATPGESVDALLASPFYAPPRTVALYTWTDVMALPDSRTHLVQLLEEMISRKVPNPVVLITKCSVPGDVVEVINAARARGLTIIVYLSYSGLGRHIERGIRRDATAENFPKLSIAGIPIVHYWRPALPESATNETMQDVLDHVAEYAMCTVAAGLKVEKAALPRLAKFWPELAEKPGVTEAEGVYPRRFWEFIHRTWRRHAHYPVFHTNSCALSYVLRRADSFGIFGTNVCRVRNLCPAEQRFRCTTADAERTAPTSDSVQSALQGRGLAGIAWRLSGDGREVLIDAPVDTRVVAAVTQDLGVRVRVRRNDDDGYWSSGTAGATPVILG
ncbi:hypothetical protein [Saccharopolyspora thermophila]|uniref:Uncharacterized protein n=1 Tax=Saccharopolyspora thermophila TaxID=89367 RepID=A0ABN1D5K3_9PSEU